MDFLSVMNFFAVFTIVFILYRVLIEEKKEKTKDHYTLPAWNFFLKKTYAQYILNKKKKRQKKFLNELKNYEHEAPKILPHDDSSDTQKIFGSDHEGNSLMIKFTRRRHRIAEIWLILRIKCGQTYQTYTLPDHPHTKCHNATPRVFEGSNLKFECLVPYSRWRITYIGMLRKGISQTLTDDENNFHFVRMNFIWTAKSNPTFWPYEWSTGLMAHSLAAEPWRDGKWKNLINFSNVGYCQFGACKGQVRFYKNDYEAYKQGLLPKVETIEYNFPGIRLRRWGPHKNEHLHKTGMILGMVKDGTVIEVGAFSSKIGVTHSQFGNVRVPTGDVYPIEWTDFHLASLGEYQDQLPEATIVQIEAGGFTFIAVITFKNSEKVPLFGGGGSGGERWNAFIVPVDIMCNTVRGFGSAIFWYPRNIRQFEIEEFSTEIKRIFHRTDEAKAEKQVISFADQDAQSISVAGGKGASLAILRIIQETKDKLMDHRGRSFEVFNALVDQFSSNALRRTKKFNHLMESESPRRGRQRSGSITKTIFPDPNDVDPVDFYVPQGFIISVSAFDEHVKKFKEIKKAIDELKAIAYEKVEGNLEAACANVQKAFKATVLSDNLKSAIVPKLDQINFDSNARFAVRSSGVTEDGENFSSAGQNQSFLGLKTNDEIFTAIVDCWSSLYSFQSVLYRKRNIQPVASSIAVVIQKMVQAESAGVLFSRHFLTGDPSVIVITANYGNGESVVAGKSEIDTYLVKRDYKGENFELLASLVGDKKFIIEMDDETAMREVKVDEDKRRKNCLHEDIVLRLAKLSITIEKFFGTPRDIEFAITKDKKIFLLQSRSITALNFFTDYEIIHETDSAVMSINEVFTRGNMGEVLGIRVCKLTQDIVKNTIDKMSSKNFGLERNYHQLYLKYMHCFYDYVFMDVYNMFLNAIGKKISIIDSVMGVSIFGSDIINEYPQLKEIAEKNNVFKSNLYEKYNQMRIFSLVIFKDSIKKRGVDAVEKMKLKLCEKNLLRYKTSSDIFDLIIRELENFEIATQSHLYMSTNSILFNIIAFAILTHESENLSLQHTRDMTLVLSSIGNIESANIPQMLKDIARSIKARGRDDKFLDVENDVAMEWLKTNSPESHDLLMQFMQRHGHRGLTEYDLMSKPWEMNSGEIIKMVKSNIHVASQLTGSKHMSVEEIMSEIKTPLTNISRKILKRLILKCHDSVRFREDAKSKLIEGVNLIRYAVIFLSQKMVNEGLLPEKELIFHLQMNEIKAIIRHRDSTLINKAVKRQKIYQESGNLKFDDFSFGVPKPISQNDKQITEYLEGEIIVKGTPVCNGCVTGNACVIRDFSEVGQLKKGDILITYCTDIAWSPYFSLISGLCTEIGGIISHGAVVARECSLPCIVSAARATDKIKTGDKIILNANDGVIIKAYN